MNFTGQTAQICKGIEGQTSATGDDFVVTDNDNYSPQITGRTFGAVLLSNLPRLSTNAGANNDANYTTVLSWGNYALRAFRRSQYSSGPQTEYFWKWMYNGAVLQGYTSMAVARDDIPFSITFARVRDIDSGDIYIFPLVMQAYDWLNIGNPYYTSSLQTMFKALNLYFSFDPYSTDDNQTPPGGYGPYDYTSETETPPQLPGLSAAQVGFVSLWNPTQSEMQGLANYLWTGTFDLTNFKKLFTDPMECVLSVGIIPITPTREASKREIVFGGSSHSGVSAYPVTEQFYIVDMGTLHITGMSQGALDYSPYAKASIYLPYCGTYALDVDEIMDSDISLEYHVDIYTGACVAYLTINNRTNSDGSNVHNVMYQFTGNCLASIPVTSGDHSQLLQSLLFMGASIAATVATAGAGAASGGAIEGLAAEGDVVASSGVLGAATAGSAINTVMSMKPNVQHSGNLSTTAGMLGGQKPFITMTWSNLCKPEDEYKLVGLPLHKSGTLSDFEGFTIVSACHMDNILCTDTELQMIEQALAKGVII